MKPTVSILLICLFSFAHCGGEENECVPLLPGYYEATLDLAKDGCHMGAPRQMNMLLDIEEGNKKLQCGSHESTSADYDSALQCHIASTMSIETAGDGFGGKFTMKFVCLEGGAGYLMIDKQKTCFDE